MDLRMYYAKLREVEGTITDPFPVMKSKETGDGGKLGVFTETTRKIAAKMIVEGTAEVASPEEVRTYQEQKAEAIRSAEQAAAAAKVQVAVLSTDDFKRFKIGSRAAKD